MWSVGDGRLLWSRSDAPTSLLALSPDGKRLATSGYRQDASDRRAEGLSVRTEVTLWSLPSGRRLAVDGLGDLVNFDLGGRLAPPKPQALSFSADSRLLAAGFSGDDRFPTLVYDAARGGRIASVPVAGTAVAFSPDGGQLLVRDVTGWVSSFDARTRHQLDRFRAPTGGDSHLLFSADRRWLVGSTGAALDVWDAGSRDLVLSQLPLPSGGSIDAPFLAAPASGHLFVATQTSLVDIDFDSSRWARIACSLAGRPLTDAELRQYLPGQTVADPCTT
jgi:WD40 repeat protein